MRVLICGGRDFENELFMRETLCPRLWRNGDYNLKHVIIHGGARGADTLAGEFARNFHCDTEVYHANWNKYGKAAGHIRNKQMLDEGKPNLVIAFPGGKGTANMIKQAKAAGVEVEIVSYP